MLFPKHEYEFRLVVCDSSEERIENILNEIANLCNTTVATEELVFYAKPHFRYRNGRLETKRIVNAEAVYHKGFWFRWVHSIETPFEVWKLHTHKKFVVEIGNAQDGFIKESRKKVTIDSRTQVYAFRNDGTNRIAFEWEYGVFKEPLTKQHGKEWLKVLSTYNPIFECFSGLNYPPRSEGTFAKQLSRKKVVCVNSPLQGKGIFVAHKWDGIFGLVYSYRDRLKEKWEGNKRNIRSGYSLGDGIVFAAEKMGSRAVVLLDVYRVRGENVAQWNRRAILTQFLPSIRESLPPEYRVQEYRRSIEDLPPASLKTDGYVFHDVVKDKAYKLKTLHTIDVLYRDGYFWLTPIKKRFKCNKSDMINMQNNCIYEVSADDGRVIKMRNDRFIGNTMRQILNVFECNPRQWTGHPLEDLPIVQQRKKTT